MAAKWMIIMLAALVTLVSVANAQNPGTITPDLKPTTRHSFEGGDPSAKEKNQVNSNPSATFKHKQLLHNDDVCDLGCRAGNDNCPKEDCFCDFEAEKCRPWSEYCYQFKGCSRENDFCIILPGGCECDYDEGNCQPIASPST